MDVVINAIGMPFNGETIKQQALGGSETAAYYLAHGIAKRGHRVTVFGTTDKEGTWDGVNYVNAGTISDAAPLGERFTFYALSTPHDVLIAQRNPLAFHKDWASKINIWQLHDLALHRTASLVQGGLARVDFTTVVSEFHAKQVSEVYSIPRSAIRVVPNGIDPSLYATSAGFFGPETDHQFKLLYQSRPERGLEHLVRPGGIMDRLRNTRAHLYVCGYEFTTAQMAPYYEQLNVWAAALPNVTILGSLTKPRLAALQKSCDLLCYPTEFEEVSCITAMEAMAAHLPMLSSLHGALPETCKSSGTTLLPLKNGRADEDAFVREIETLIADLDEEDRIGTSQIGAMRASQALASSRYSWDRAVDTLLRDIERQFAVRAASPARVLKHCIEHSDVAFADWYRNRAEAPEMQDAVCRMAIHELDEMFAFARSQEATHKHYEHFEGINIDQIIETDMEIDAVISQTQQTSRFRGIAQEVAHVARSGKSLRALEFGCAHGHITLSLAKLFPDVHFTGMDFMGRSVGVAIKYAGDLGASNAEFVRGSLADIEALGKFDVIVAAEVIEHILDYHGAIETLRKSLAPGGRLVFTTPAGRWEWSGHDAFRGGREHMHHFERADWQDILAAHPEHAITYAPFTPEETGGQRGSWIVGVQPSDASFGRINYERKLSTLAPRETLSACLIVRNGQHVIGKALASIATYVDEIVIAIDPTTNDRTEATIADARGDFPWVPITIIEGVRALQDGFAAARNRTLDAACGDWILWMDADEECPQLFNAWRLLRPSGFNAFGCPQIHYSAQPAQVLTTDYPARLFRNGRGVRFHGYVHEHPEDAPGKSIANISVASDIQFLHNGYVDERTRRARYQRNLPLLMRDVNENPDRILNKFLLLRDIAQGIGFEAQLGRRDPQAYYNNARQGIAIMHEMIDRKDIPLRMILDGIQYYSICCDVLGAGFTVKLSWGTGKPMMEALNTSGSIEGRVHDRVTYFKLLNRIAEESTRHYESQYA